MMTPQIPNLSIGVATDPGRKRHGEPNQDAVLVVPAERDRLPLFIVADGMGGHVGGAEASHLVVEAVAARYRQIARTDDLAALLQECLLSAYNTLADHVSGHPDLNTMGSTAVLAIPQAGQVLIANVGDSRAYLMRHKNLTALDDTQPSPFSGAFSHQSPSTLSNNENSTVEIEQISYDHSVVADLVRAGQLTPLQALQSPLRNRLTQSITPHRPGITPYFRQAPFGMGDTLLLCTDGLWGVVPEATLAAIALELPPQEAANKLVRQAISYGGPDNISVILARQTYRP